MKIHCYLSAVLGAKRLKIWEVVENTGISRTTLTNMYYDRSKGVYFDVLEKLCAYLDCEVQDIFRLRVEE